MKVFLRDIPFEGLEVEESLGAADIGLTDEGFVCLTPLNIQAHFDKVENELLAQVTVTAAYELSCARCLEPVRQERTDSFELVFDITPETEFIEWGDEVRQELLVRLTAIIRCREDCKGLCPSCGANLNKGACKCPKPKETLKGINIKLKKK